MPRLPLHPGAVYGVFKEIKAAAEDFEPLLTAGEPKATAALARALAAGGDEGAVRDLRGRPPTPYDLEGAGLLLYAVAGPEPAPEDVDVFRLADRKNVPVLCLLRGGSGEPADVPFVLATDVLRLPAAGEPLTEELVAAVVERLDDDKAYAYAARLPVLRRPVAEAIVRRFARQNAVIGVAVFVPGADFPVLTLNQLRMILNLAAAYGEPIDRERALEILGAVGAGLGFRSLAQRALTLVPGPGWAIKGGIAYSGTRALGEAAIRYFEAGGQGRLKEYVRARS